MILVGILTGNKQMYNIIRQGNGNEGISGFRMMRGIS